MEKHVLSPDTLLGRVVSTKEKYQLVHLSLKAGNEVPEYTNEAAILILLLSGEVKLISREEMILSAGEVVEIEPMREHKMIALKDSQIVAVKIF